MVSRCSWGEAEGLPEPPAAWWGPVRRRLGEASIPGGPVCGWTSPRVPRSGSRPAQPAGRSRFLFLGRGAELHLKGTVTQAVPRRSVTGWSVLTRMLP